MEQCTRDLKNPITTEEHDCFSFPIEPLRSISPTNKPKRSSTHSKNSGITSALVSFRTPVLSPAIPLETSTPHPSSSPHAQTAQYCRPGKLSVRFNNLFLTVLPSWLEVASTCAPKSLKMIAFNQNTSMLSQY